ncbi:TlpA family protein disulfide reductase, partial [Pseudomonas carnis]|nr:TlpA family protein disulfide reductase [Pseudomonas carnis]
GELSEASLARAMAPFDNTTTRKPTCLASATC